MITQININVSKLVAKIKKDSLTYRQVVALTGINLKTLCYILNNKSAPRPSTIDKIEDGLGLKKGSLRC